MAHEPGREMFDREQSPSLVGNNGNHPLDEPRWRAHHKKLIEWRSETRTAHSINRADMARDADFVDGDQWNERDAKALTDRGQAPLKFNLTAKFTRWITGTERRTRIESTVLPRSADDVDASDSKTKLLKYVNQVSKAQFARSKAFEDAVHVGVGWLEDGVRSDPNDEPLFSRYESWRNMWWDALSKEDDLSDARYLFREKFLDLDVAMTMWPDRAAALKLASDTHELFAEEEHDENFRTALYWRDDETGKARATSQLVDHSFHIGTRRQRVRIIECWYRVPERTRVLRTFQDIQTPPELIGLIMKENGRPFDETSPLHLRLVESGYASLYDAIKMRVRVAIFTLKNLLQDLPSPYNHDRFPFTPIWAYRRNRDGMPYGVVRNMIDPQDDLNKRRSKSLFILSTRGMIADRDAFDEDEWDEVEEELARPDYILKPRRNTRIEINTDTELARQHVDLMREDASFLESASGVTEENTGEVTNAISGRAILARQSQGSVVTAGLFDNLRRSVQHQGEIQLSLIEQFYDQPKIIRLTGSGGDTTFSRINFPVRQPDGTVVVENDITRTAADFIVVAQDWRETVRLAMFEQLMEMISNLDPSVSIKLLDLVFELSDLPHKEEIVKRIRSINGEVGPDDPDAAEKQAAKDQSEAEQAELQRRMQEADAKAKEGTAEQKIADAARKRGDAMQMATELAAQLRAFPELAPAVDSLFRSFQEGRPEESAAPIPPAPPGGAAPAGGPAPSLPQPQSDVALSAPETLTGA